MIIHEPSPRGGRGQTHMKFGEGVGGGILGRGRHQCKGLVAGMCSVFSEASKDLAWLEESEQRVNRRK